MKAKKCKFHSDFFFFYFNNLLYGAHKQTMVATFCNYVQKDKTICKKKKKKKNKVLINKH